MPDPARTTLHQHPERAVPDGASAVLAAGLVAHVGIADADGPVVIPMTYHFSSSAPRTLYLHGAHNSRLMNAVASGANICVTVTMIDALVSSKTATGHTVNYRSAVCFCRAAAVQPDAARKRALLDDMIERYWPGRTAGVEYAPATDAKLDATAFVALTIESCSAKARSGGSLNPADDDPAVPGTAAVTALRPGL